MHVEEWTTQSDLRMWYQLNGISRATERALEMNDIKVLTISAGLRQALYAAGISTVGQLVATPWPIVWAITGVGPVRLEHLSHAVNRLIYVSMAEAMRRSRMPIQLSERRASLGSSPAY
jgi:hypothetical protein